MQCMWYKIGCFNLAYFMLLKAQLWLVYMCMMCVLLLWARAHVDCLLLLLSVLIERESLGLRACAGSASLGC